MFALVFVYVVLPRGWQTCQLLIWFSAFAALFCSFAYSGPPISDFWGSIFLSKAHLPTELDNFQPIEFFFNVTFCISFISRMHVSHLHNRAPNIILFKNSAQRNSNLKKWQKCSHSYLNGVLSLKYAAILTKSQNMAPSQWLVSFLTA